MPWWQWVLEAAGLLLLAVLLYGIALIVRRRILSRHGGTFELSYRVRSERAGRGWLLGIGRYSGDRLEWFRIFSVSPRPKRSWERSDLEYVSSRFPEGPEQLSLYPEHVVVACRHRGAEMEIAMGRASLTGFQSWLEARPPGTDWTR